MKRYVIGVSVGVVLNLAVRYVWWVRKQRRRVDSLIDAWMSGDVARADQIEMELAEAGVYVERVEYDEEDEM